MRAILLLLILALLPAGPAAAQDDPPPSSGRSTLPGPAVEPKPVPPGLQDEEEDPEDGPSDRSDGAGTTAPEDRPPPPEPRAPGDVPKPGSVNFDTNAGQEREQLRIPPSNTMVSIDFVDTDLKDIVKYFAEITGRNFIIDSQVKGKLTIISPKKMTIAEAYEAFLSALQHSGFTTVTVGKLTKIVPSQSGQNNPLRIYDGDYVPYTDNFITRILSLRNVDSGSISKLVQGMLSKGGNLTAYEPNNTLIITDSAANIRRIEEIIAQLDVSAPTQRLVVIPIQYADAAQVMEKIRAIYGEEASGTAAAAQPARPTRTTRNTRANRRNRNQPEPAAAQATTVGAPALISKMIADERTNSIIVLATETALEDIKELIAELDKNVSVSTDLHVIYLRHAKAEDLVTVLTQVVQAGSQGQQNAAAPRTRQPAARGRTAQAQQPQASSSSLSGEFGQNVRITADPATNSLVITAGPDDFRRLDHVIKRLDIERRQVFVETVIMEISDNRSSSVGLSWSGGQLLGAEEGTTGIGGFGMPNILSIGALATDADALAGLALGILGRSVDVTLPNPSGAPISLSIPAFGIILQAVQEDTSVNVLSAPNILTLDNQEAEIVVGETVPFVTSQSRDNNNNPILSITREDVALTLRVTPQISEGRTVTLEVEQEISEVKGNPGLDVLTSVGPTTTRRNVTSVVAVQDNQTIVLGGLIQNSESLTERKVPILGDIPIIGALFRNRSKSFRRTNLLIFLTPHIITSPEDLEEVYRIKLAQRDEFLRRFYGKTAEERDKELRGLLAYSVNFPDSPSLYRDKEFMIEREDDLLDPEPPRTEEDLMEEGDTLIRPDRSEEIIGPDEDLPEDSEPLPDETQPEGGEE